MLNNLVDLMMDIPVTSAKGAADKMNALGSVLSNPSKLSEESKVSRCVLVHWFVCLLAGWLDWLVGWLVGCFLDCLFVLFCFACCMLLVSLFPC